MDISTAYLVAFGVVGLAQIITLYIVLEIHRRRPSQTDGLFRESQAKTHSIIYTAIQKANKILVAAELKGLQLISKEKMTGDELSVEFRKHLDAIEKALETQLSRNARHATDTYGAFIATAEQKINDHIAQNQKMLEEKAQMMIEKTESLLTKFTADLEAKVKGDVQKELAAASAEINDYKQSRMRIIDERIVDILEAIIQVVLEKKMSLADQSELIYKALSDAKREHSFNAKPK